MKILIVCPYFYPESGGLENYVYNIAKGIIKKGHSITVLCATKEKQGKKETIDGIKVIRQKPDIIISNTPVKLNLYFTLIKLLKKERFDLVNAHTPVPYYADMACYASKKQNIPFILTYHNDNIHPNTTINSLCNLYNYTLNSLTLSLSTKIITPSPFCFNQSKFLKKHKNKLLWVPPGIDSDRFKPDRNKYVAEKYNLPKDSEVVLFVGQMGKFHKHKCVDILIDAFSNVCNTIPNSYLVLAGKGDAKEYKAQCRKQNIEKKVIFAGFVKDNELPKYYQSAQILVLPTVTEQEGFGMTLIEAMACGTPVIGTNIGGIPYVVINDVNGLLIPANDSKALLHAMIRILEEEKLTKRLTKNTHKINEKFNWNKSIEKTFNVYNSLS